MCDINDPAILLVIVYTVWCYILSYGQRVELAR